MVMDKQIKFMIIIISTNALFNCMWLLNWKKSVGMEASAIFTIRFKFEAEEEAEIFYIALGDRNIQSVTTQVKWSVRLGNKHLF